MNTMYMEQDGIGLPDPKYYTDNPQAVAGYQEVAAAMLTLAGVATGNGADEAKVRQPTRAFVF
jgi:predicted metalloendopeptidase